MVGGGNFVGGFSIIFTLLLLFLGIIGLVIYFIPTVIALKRNHINKVPIILVNILLGWSFIGWIVALIWACSNSDKPVIINNTMPIPPGSESVTVKLQELSKLRADGIISEDEFQSKKAELLSRM